jgi:predicted small lipoprotein YifL
MTQPHFRHVGTTILVWMTALLMGTLLMTGCGKKGPPKLPDVEAPPGVTDLTAIREGEEIVLTWTAAPVREDKTGPAGYHVYRSAEPAGAEDCPGCPVLFKRAARVPLAGEVAGSQSLEYRESLMTGTRYSFKVVPYDSRGQMGADSNIVSIVATD